jgi:cytochrome P450 / NADPH-cytochrome P450 reductase
MLEGTDPVTGKHLPESNVKNNLLTFLIAGHETTSGLLSFLTFYLLKNPECMKKLREEVDTVLGKHPLQVQDLNKLPYLVGMSISFAFTSNTEWQINLPAAMRETLRLTPSAPQRGLEPVVDGVLGGKYAIKTGTVILANIYDVHRDPLIWGNDVCLAHFTGFLTLLNVLSLSGRRVQARKNARWKV